MSSLYMIVFLVAMVSLVYLLFVTWGICLEGTTTYNIIYITINIGIGLEGTD